MAEGSYWSSEFFCPTIAEFLDESVCENTEDVAGAGELVLDATDTGTRTQRSHTTRTMDNKQQGDAPTPTALPTSWVQAAPKPTWPEGYRQEYQQLGTYGGLRRWQKQRGITVATTV